ncbi:MAG: hypothetical protein JWO82_4248 [Akkermansiaceae bacterium]|nr:hypothetical protein [Akkermansiaceae bacterium]
MQNFQHFSTRGLARVRGLFMVRGMRRRSAAALVLAILPLASCVTPKDPDDKRKPVGPESDTSKIPWNQPISGQGGGILSAMPKTPRR